MKKNIIVMLVVFLGGLSLITSVLFPQQLLSASATYTFGPSGHDGGGGQSAIAVDPFHPGTIVSGADISGFHRSTDYGRNWTPVNIHAAGSQAMFSLRMQYKVASVVFSKKTADKLYAGVGHQGANGGFVLSTDGGRTWTLKSTVPQFCGGNTASPLPNPGHPRSVGKLIVLDPSQTNEYIYAGTYSQGLMRSNDDGATWTTLGLSGKYIRGVAIDENNPQTLYVACYDTNGGTSEAVYKVTSARGTPDITRLDTSFFAAEELVVVNGVLYVAANADGVWKYDGTAWTQLYTDSTPSIFYSIDGYWNSSTGKAVIFAGTADHARPVAGSTYLHYSIIRSTDSGATWTCLTDDETKLHRNMPMGDADGEIWWHSQHDTWYQPIMGGITYVACQLVLDPTDYTHNRLYSAGRAGTWRTDNALAADPDWYPAMRHMNVTINRGVVADPNDANRVDILDVDWVYLWSTDKLSHMYMNKPTEDSEYCLALDSTTDPSNPSTVYLGAGTNLYYLADPLTPGSAWSTILSGQGRVLGVTVKKVGTERVVIAACEGTGIWRKQGSADWVNVYNSDSVLTNMAGQDKAIFSWGGGTSATVYFTDRVNGIYRSLDNGSTWTRVNSSIVGSGDMAKYCGFVSLDPTDDNILYISNTGGVWKSANAKASNPTFSDITSAIPGLGVPAALTHDDDGNVYLASIVTATQDPKLFFLQKGGGTWTDIADPGYKAQAGFLWQISVGPRPDHVIYAACDATGVTVGTLASLPTPTSTPTPTPTPTPTSAPTPTPGNILFSDDFEGGNFNNWGNASSTTAEIWTANVHQGAYSARIYNLTGEADLLSKPHDTTGKYGMTLTYWIKMPTLASGHKLLVEYTTDGTTYVAAHTLSAVIAKWTQKTFTFPSSCDNNPNFKFRFRAPSAYFSGSDVAYLDEIVVSD